MSQQAAPPPNMPTRRRVLRDEVYDVLLEMLTGGHFNGGDSLGIDPLAAQLGVSPTPVREALVQLESTGLVTRTALRGYRVAPPMSKDAMEQLFDARLLIEVGAARRAYARREELAPQLRRLHEHQEARARLLVDGRTDPDDASIADLREYIKADQAFHNAVFQATGNRFIVEMAQHISTHEQRLKQFVQRRDVDAELALAEHLRLLEAYERGQEDDVAEAARAHIEAVRVRAMADAVEEVPVAGREGG